jgi:hypothetical protein
LAQPPANSPNAPDTKTFHPMTFDFAARLMIVIVAQQALSADAGRMVL